MRVRYANRHNITGWASRTNPVGLGEVIVTFDDGDASSEFVRDLEVRLASGEWVAMGETFRRRDLITDNYDREFGEPRSDAERERGWFE